MRGKGARVSANSRAPEAPPAAPLPRGTPGPTHLGAARGRAAGSRAGSGPWLAAEPGRPQGLSPPRRRGRERARREAAARAWPCPPWLRGGVGAGGRSPGPGGAAAQEVRWAGRHLRAGRGEGAGRARQGAATPRRAARAARSELGSPGPSLGDAHAGFRGGHAPRLPQGLLPKPTPNRQVFKPGRVS